MSLIGSFLALVDREGAPDNGAACACERSGIVVHSFPVLHRSLLLRPQDIHVSWPTRHMKAGEGRKLCFEQIFSGAVTVTGGTDG